MNLNTLGWSKPIEYQKVLEEIPLLYDPPFEDEAEQVRNAGRRWGVNNDVGTLRVVLMHRPGDEFKSVTMDSFRPELGCFLPDDYSYYWRSEFGDLPNIPLLQEQHGNIVKALEAEGVQVVFVDKPIPNHIKTIFMRDSLTMVEGGAIIARHAIKMRRGDEMVAYQKVASMGIPVLHTVHGRGAFEGGSFMFLNEKTAAVGLSSRVNKEGAEQVEAVLKHQGVRLIKIDLVGNFLHIDGGIVMVDEDLALVDVTKLPYWFINEIRDMGIKLIDVHPEENWFGVNVLATRPGRVLAPLRAERTNERLLKAGVEVIPIDVSEINKNGGGIHCATMPLLRDKLHG